MNIRLLRCLFILLLLGSGLFHASRADAQITCTTASMSAVSFGTVNPLSSQTSTTATLTYTCTNLSVTKTHSATICFSIGEPAGAQTSPRLMSSGANTLQFQMYWGSPNGTIWGSQFFGSNTPYVVNLTLGGLGSSNGSATLYAQVLPGQTTAAPGLTYADNYQNGDTAITINDVQGSTAPGTCSGTQSGVYFPFRVSATTQKNCNVTANNLTFANVAAGGAVASGSTNIGVTCSNTTPYYIGLAPQNVAGTTGAGTMKGTGGNTNAITYQLYSNSSLSTVWGNTATTTTVGNGVAGTGSGTAQALTVYAKVTGSTDVKPDTYSDTVQINVNY